MLDWLDGIAGPDYARAILWTLAALILLVIVLVIVKLVRSMTFGTFVAGGRNRKTRLAVMDATAVDSHRRLVLIRRDDIEHLLLIGGPTDVVVERDIRMVAPRRPVMTGDGGQHPVSAQRTQPAQIPARQVQPQTAAMPSQPARPREQAERPPVPPTFPPVTANPPPPVYPARNASYAPQKQSSAHDAIDDTFMNELEMSLDDFSPQREPASQPNPAPKVPASLDDEMTKLLGELSNHKK
jgi:hypothetical protein